MQRLVVGVACHQAGELGDQLAVSAEPEPDVDPRPEGLVAQPLEVRGLLAHDRWRFRQVREGGSAPEPHRPRQDLVGRLRVAVGERPGLRDRIPELLGVQLVRIHAERIAGPRTDDALPVRWLAEECPEAGHVDVQQVMRARRRTVAPQLVDEPIIGDGRPG